MNYLSLVAALLVLGLTPGCNSDHGAADSGDDGAVSVDTGAFACDAPPIAYCRAHVTTGGPGCCGGSVEPLCRSGGGYACPAGSLELTACTSCSSACDAPSDCVVVPASCCGQCGVATASDLVALSTTDASPYRDTVCAGSSCPDCAAMPDPYLVATCDAAACRAVNLHVDPLTSCAADTDCTLAPSTCCGCGEIGASDAIAFNPSAGSLDTLICDPHADCPPCVPTFSGITAQCVGGRCAVVPTP